MNAMVKRMGEVAGTPGWRLAETADLDSTGGLPRRPLVGGREAARRRSTRTCQNAQDFLIGRVSCWNSAGFSD